MLVDATFKTWCASAKAKHIAQAGAAATGTDLAMVSARKALLVSPELVALKQAFTAASADYRARTLPWYDNGARILSSMGFADFEIAMRDHERVISGLVTAFVVAYPAQRQAAKYLLNGEFDARDYPEPWQIADRFSVAFEYMPFPESADMRVDIGAAALATVQASCDRAANLKLDRAMRAVWQQIADVLAPMVERLTLYKSDDTGVSGKFHDTLVTNVRDLVALLPSLNLTGDQTMTDVTARMQSELLAFTPETLRASPDARAKTAQAASAILGTMGSFV
jgi:hypothetical protein